MITLALSPCPLSFYWSRWFVFAVHRSYSPFSLSFLKSVIENVESYSLFLRFFFSNGKIHFHFFLPAFLTLYIFILKASNRSPFFPYFEGLLPSLPLSFGVVSRYLVFFLQGSLLLLSVCSFPQKNCLNDFEK